MVLFISSLVLEQILTMDQSAFTALHVFSASNLFGRNTTEEQEDCNMQDSMDQWYCTHCERFEDATVNVIPEQFHMMLAPPHKMGKPSPLVEELKPAIITHLKVGNDNLSDDGDDIISSGQVCWQAGRQGGGKAGGEGQAID
jgi:hypothetical protein